MQDEEQDRVRVRMRSEAEALRDDPQEAAELRRVQEDLDDVRAW